MEKIKYILKYTIESSKAKEILVILILIVIGFGAFGLGRLSKNSASSGIRIQYPDQAAVAIESLDNFDSIATPVSKVHIDSSSTKNFFASKKGHKYYPVGCSAGKSIKLVNRVYFATSEAAKSAGYDLSASCH